jgi:hypothetical protein
MKNVLILIPFLTLLFSACEPERLPADKVRGKIILEFKHSVDGQSLIKDSLAFINEAGNIYEVNELKYFISDVFLTDNSGKQLLLDDEKVIHYVDIDIPGTEKWKVFDPIPEGTYDSIVFVFGLNEARNVSFAFVNPPEVNMFWPDILGGGYHYMMINGKWIDPENKTTPFDFHLGIGQLYSGITTSVDSITGFVHNYFRVALPLSGLKIEDNTTHTITLEMNIASWFKTPHIWDFNLWGGYIMQNQTAMKNACENGCDVFSISGITKTKNAKSE